MCTNANAPLRPHPSLGSALPLRQLAVGARREAASPSPALWLAASALEQPPEQRAPTASSIDRLCPGLCFFFPLKALTTSVCVFAHRDDPGTESGRECGDRQDNDGDGISDCDDPDCATAPNCMRGGRGGRGGTDDPGTETNRECGDGQDNDGDGVSDCDDPDCATAPPCMNGGRGGRGGQTDTCTVSPQQSVAFRVNPRVFLTDRAVCLTCRRRRWRCTRPPSPPPAARAPTAPPACPPPAPRRAPRSSSTSWRMFHTRSSVACALYGPMLTECLRLQ